MAFDIGAGKLVLFGGAAFPGPSRYQPYHTLNDTWTWSGGTWQQSFSSSPPLSRALSAMAYDGGTQGLLLFGGQNQAAHDVTTDLGDTWEWGR